MANLGDIRIDNGEVHIYSGSKWRKYSYVNDNNLIIELIKKVDFLEQRIEELEAIIENNNILFD